jgi:pimeloyl-ACP methyl ester carboxylesterase
MPLSAALVYLHFQGLNLLVDQTGKWTPLDVTFTPASASVWIHFDGLYFPDVLRPKFSSHLTLSPEGILTVVETGSADSFASTGSLFDQLKGSATWSATQKIDLKTGEDTVAFTADLAGQYIGGAQVGTGKPLGVATNCTISSHYSGKYNRVDAITLIPPLETPKTANIFIGGFFDQTYGHVVENYLTYNPIQIPNHYYCTHNADAQIEALINSLPNNTIINLIGHSYGGDTAVNVAARSKKKINLLITIDPVGGLSVSNYPNPSQGRVGQRSAPIDPSWRDRLLAKFKALRPNTLKWINVDASPDQLDLSDWVANAGGKWDDIPLGYADIFILAHPYHHGNFKELMQDYTGPTGQKNPLQFLLNY